MTMTDGGTRLELKGAVRGPDGMLGELGDVVVDPLRGRVTHLVVRSRSPEFGSARLVPIELVMPGEARPGVELRCTQRDFGRLEPVGEVVAVGLGEPRRDDPDWDVGIVDVLDPPYPTAELGGTDFPADVTMIYDRVPKNEAELRRSSRVQSCDAHDLGHVEALVVGERARLTGVVLRHRRLWAQSDVALPFDTIEEIRTDLVTLALTRRQVKQLPHEPVHRA